VQVELVLHAGVDLTGIATALAVLVACSHPLAVTELAFGFDSSLEVPWRPIPPPKV
jgi:hypothetical protein